MIFELRKKNIITDKITELRDSVYSLWYRSNLFPWHLLPNTFYRFCPCALRPAPYYCAFIP
jgi:hypothetical protein